MYSTLILEFSGEIARITLNRPDKRNAINPQMMCDLQTAFDTIEKSHSRVVILTGAGKCFCAGMDLDMLATIAKQSAAENQEDSRRIAKLLRRIWSFPRPLIAAVNGAAYAGGCEMVLCCDFAYASTRARFALTEVTLGIMPGAGGTQNLPRALGARRAKEILLTGRPFDAQQAYEWGLINRLCEPDRLQPEVLETAVRISENAPLSTRQIKHSVNYGAQMDLASALMFEIEAYNRLVPTEDRREGIASFNEKRKPTFKGK